MLNDPGCRVLVALSGGADSMALLALLLARGADVCAAHFNHMIRGAEADADERFAAEYCRAKGVPFRAGRGDVPGFASENGLTLEQAGRQLRYEFLYGAAEELGAERIALAHHMDDQAETLLLNLARGAGLSGLCGMKALSGRLWRPLLGYRKAELLKYCDSKGVPYREDSTNFCPDYARNRVRALIPELEKVNAAFVRNCARTASLLAEDDAALNSLALPAVKSDGGRQYVDIAALNGMEPAVKARALRLLAASEGLGADFERKHICAALALCGGQSGKSIDLAHGFTAKKSYGRLYIERARAAQETYELPFSEGEFALPGGRLRIERISPPEKLGAGFPMAMECAPGALEGAVIRQKREGDRITPLGCGGSRRLKDVLSDKKVPAERRKRPVIAEGGEVLLAAGVCMGEKLRLTGGESYAYKISWEDDGDA